MAETAREAGPDAALAALLQALPHLPGVYRMLGEGGQVLYVGKALDLRKRVNSYFQRTAQLGPRIRMMVSQVQTIETTVTRSESEALLLENNLIKSLAPRYNILFRDDKSYPYLMLSAGTYPRIAFHRGPLEPRHRYFGPFSNASAVRESIALLQKVFRLRTCEDSQFSSRSRPCLLHQIQRCSGPCVGLVAEQDYAEDVRAAGLFLLGREDEVLERLEGRMAQAAERMEYEQAAAFRDQIRALRTVRQRQFVSSERARDVDVLAVAAQAGVLCVNRVTVRAGMHRGDKSYFPDHAEELDAEEALRAFLTQLYVEREVPPLILVNLPGDFGDIAGLLAQQCGHPVQIATAHQGEGRVWTQMAQTNAELALGQRRRQRDASTERQQALREGLGLAALERIECFDVSHTFGEATVASCVVWEGGRMNRSLYRRFNITGLQGGDDYGAMRQVLERRYRRVVGEEGTLPDLILIDGGLGQVNVAAEVLGELGLGALPLVGVAKGPERKAGMEELVYAGGATLRLAPDDPGLHLVQEVRDEAHRFAIEGHRARRAKTRRTSALESIEGIGAKRRQRLLARFGGLKGVVAASVEELQQVEGISQGLAERIYQHLH